MPSDYFDSSIKIGGKTVSRIFGTYCGFIEIDGIRYWDARDYEPYEIMHCEDKLESDWRNRPDLH